MPSRSYSGTALSSSANDASISETSTTCPRPVAEHVAVVERREDALDGEHRGERVAERDARARRRLAGEAVDVAEAAHRLRDRGVAGALGVRPGLAVPGDAREDDARVHRREPLVAEVPPLERARAEVLGDDVRDADELEQQLLALSARAG